MPHNIFKEPDYESIVKRVENLRRETRSVWGKMNLLQMLEHCSLQLQLALGMIQQSTFEGPSIMRTNLGRWLALYAMPWSKNLRTPSKMNMHLNNTPVPDFENAKEQLLELLNEVKTSQELKPHPFFGPMSQKDWGRLIWKHLDHHLKQFGG